MSYHNITVDPLSEPQIRKLLKGEPARVKYNKNGSHSLNLSNEQCKKLATAHKKGGGCNITMDPYQVDQHQEMKGSGLKSWAKKQVRSALNSGKKAAIKEGKRQGSKYLKKGEDYLHTQVIPKYSAKAELQAHKQSSKAAKSLRARLDMADSDDEFEDIDGEGLFKDVWKKVKKPASKLAIGAAKQYILPVAKTYAKQGAAGAVAWGAKKVMGSALRPAGSGMRRRRVTGKALFAA